METKFLLRWLLSVGSFSSLPSSTTIGGTGTISELANKYRASLLTDIQEKHVKMGCHDKRAKRALLA
jgi:hypothetical protein